MLKATALARLRINAQSTSDPMLTEQELEDLLAYYALEDSELRAPDHVDWVGTWDLPAAYRKAWLMKAGKVAASVTYDVDGAKYDNSDMHAHCMAMAAKYGGVGTISIEGLS